MTRCRIVPVATLVLSFAAPSLSFAQGTQRSEDPDVEARKKEAREAVSERDAEKAYKKFNQLYALDPNERNLWDLALSEKHSGRSVDSIKHFRTWLNQSTDGMKDVARRRKFAQESIEKLSHETAHFVFEGESPGLAVVDGLEIVPIKDAATQSEIYDVPSGHHLVEARIGTRKLRQELDLAAGTTTPLRFAPDTATTPPTAVAPAPTPPSAVSPVAPPPPAAAQTDGAITKEPNEHPFRVWLAVGLGAGAVAALGGAAYLGAQSSDAASKYDRARASGSPGSCPGGPQCNDLSDSARTANTDHTWSTILYGVGVGSALAAGAVVTWIVLDNKSHAEKSMAAVPVVGPGVLGAQWRTTF